MTNTITQISTFLQFALMNKVKRKWHKRKSNYYNDFFYCEQAR